MRKRLTAVIFLMIALFLQVPAGAQEQEKKANETFLFLMAARNAAKAGKYETAINRYHRLLEKYPQLTEARKELGWVLLDTDKVQEAIKEFEIVLKVTPHDKNALRGLLEGFRKTKKKQGISMALERLVTLVPEDNDLRLQLAIELHNQGKYAEAEKHLSILLGEKNKDE